MQLRRWGSIAVFVLLGAGLAILLVLAIIRSSSESRESSRDPVVDSVKIHIVESGVYRINLSDLQRFRPSLTDLSSDVIQVTESGNPVPFIIEGDILYFYGIRPSGRYAPYRPYLISFGRPGQAMDDVEVGTERDPEIESIPITIHLEDNKIYDGRSVTNQGGDLAELNPWYWMTVENDGQVSIEFELADPSSDKLAELEAAFYGATSSVDKAPDHDASLFINGVFIGSITWDGETYHVGSLTIEPGVLKDGRNILVIDNDLPGSDLADVNDQTATLNPSLPLDIMRLDWIQIDYMGSPAAQDDLVEIKNQGGLLNIDGFSGKPLVLDISEPHTPRRIRGWEFQNGTLTMETEPDLVLAAVGPQAFLDPDEISPVNETTWQTPEKKADLIILADDELHPSLASLVEWRSGQGLDVALISTEDVYNEFGLGWNSPESISNLVHYALIEWKDPQPAYLLLVGEASYDFKDYLGQSGDYMIPSPMVRVEYGGETVSDIRLVDHDLDGLADISVGRWPVISEAEVSDIALRTIAYERGAASPRILMAADGTSDEFSDLSDEVIDRSGLSDDDVVRLYGVSSDEFIKAWNEGAWLVSYTGHGSIDRWGKDDVFSSEAVADLRSAGSTPAVIQLTCLTGFYAHPSADSISELMLRHQEGPVEIVSATSLTLSSSQRPFGVNLIRALRSPELKRIGDAIQQAKRELDVGAFSDLREISETFTLLGDPSALIMRPE